MTTKLTDADKLRRLRKLVREWRAMYAGDWMAGREWRQCMEARLFDLEENGIIPKPRKRRVKP